MIEPENGNKGKVDLMGAKPALDRPLRVRRREGPLPEIVCGACDGRGFAETQKVSSMRRIYSAACKKCGGKGRISKPV